MVKGAVPWLAAQGETRQPPVHDSVMVVIERQLAPRSYVLPRAEITSLAFTRRDDRTIQFTVQDMEEATVIPFMTGERRELSESQARAVGSTAFWTMYRLLQAQGGVGALGEDVIGEFWDSLAMPRADAYVASHPDAGLGIGEWGDIFVGVMQETNPQMHNLLFGESHLARALVANVSSAVIYDELTCTPREGDTHQSARLGAMEEIIRYSMGFLYALSHFAQSSR